MRPQNVISVKTTVLEKLGGGAFSLSPSRWQLGCPSCWVTVLHSFPARWRGPRNPGGLRLTVGTAAGWGPLSSALDGQSSLRRFPPEWCGPVPMKLFIWTPTWGFHVTSHMRKPSPLAFFSGHCKVIDTTLGALGLGRHSRKGLACPFLSWTLPPSAAASGPGKVSHAHCLCFILEQLLLGVLTPRLSSQRVPLTGSGLRFLLRRTWNKDRRPPPPHQGLTPRCPKPAPHHCDVFCIFRNQNLPGSLRFSETLLLGPLHTKAGEPMHGPPSPACAGSDGLPHRVPGSRLCGVKGQQHPGGCWRGSSHSLVNELP